MGNCSSRSSRRARTGRAGGQKPPPPPTTTKKKVVLKGVHFYCLACSHMVRRELHRVPGVEDVATDMENNQVTVTGAVEVADLLRVLYRKLGKRAVVVSHEEVVDSKEGEGEAPAAEEEGGGGESGGGSESAADSPAASYGGAAFYYGYGAPPPPPPLGCYGHGFAGGWSYSPYSPLPPPPCDVRSHCVNEYPQGNCRIV